VIAAGLPRCREAASVTVSIGREADIAVDLGCFALDSGSKLNVLGTGKIDPTPKFIDFVAA
jgi:hypothetical protein